MPAGASPFPVAKKYQNPTAAPDAMKGSGLASLVRAAPAKAEQRLLKGTASVSDKKIVLTFITVSLGIGQGGRSKVAKPQIFKALYAAVGGRTFIHQ